MSLKRKMLPIGVENFEKLRRNDMYYVDKTEMISDLIMNRRKFIYSSSPIRQNINDGYAENIF